MKKYFNGIWCIALTIVLVSCQKEDEMIKHSGQIEFVFSPGDNSGAKLLEEEEATGVLLSIEDASGNSIYNLEEIELYKLNGQYVSKPLSLEEGDYMLTEFMVISKNKEVTFITPMLASKKAYLVQHALPVAFTVSKNVVDKLAMEVLDIAENNPADFGYTTFFDFSVVPTFDFLVGVFVYNSESDNYELTHAALKVNNGDSLIYNGSLDAITNQISLRDENDTYTLRIEKEGYLSYEETFSVEALKLHLDSADLGPLVVTLDKTGSSDRLVLQGSGQVEDISISSYKPDLNPKDNYPEYLRAVAWTIDGAPVFIRNLIKFDLSSIADSTTIISAKLSLYNNDDAIAIGGPGHSKINGSNESMLQRVTENWNMNTVTWNTQPAATTTNQVILPESSSPDQNYTDIDVTALVQYMIANPNENNGLMLRLKTEQNYRSLNFCSSEHADALRHPKLKIVFE